MSDELILFEQKLEKAEAELKSWELHDLQRRDGSPRQDRIHEDRGTRLKNNVDELKSKIKGLKRGSST